MVNRKHSRTILRLQYGTQAHISQLQFKYLFPYARLLGLGKAGCSRSLKVSQDKRGAYLIELRSFCQTFQTV